MTNDEIIKKWLSAFASNVPDVIMKEHIIKSGNFLWHIFTWGNVPCVTGDEARKAFDALSFEKVIMFSNGYSVNGKTKIDNLQTHGEISSSEADKLSDVYFVDEHFRWTYVHTHEINCGPYLCYGIE